MNQEKNDDLRKVAPYLSSLEKKNSFQAPEGYFEQLPSAIQNKIGEAPAENKHKVFSLHYMKYAAAAVVLLIAGIYFYPKKTQQPINTFTAWNVDALTDDEVLDELTDYPIENETAIVVKNDDSDIINYLIDNKIDITEINKI